MPANYVRDNTRFIGNHLATTSAVTIVTGSGFIQLIGANVANISTDTYHISLGLFSTDSGATYKLIHQHDVPLNGAVYFDLNGISLNVGDKLTATAEAASKLDIVVTIAEIPGRSG